MITHYTKVPISLSNKSTDFDLGERQTEGNSRTSAIYLHFYNPLRFDSLSDGKIHMGADGICGEQGARV